MVKSIFDFTVATFALAIFAIPMVLISISIRFTCGAPVLFWSARVGKSNRLFLMPKFRTMIHKAPLVATDNFKSPKNFITPIGHLLRRTSLDELPQLLCVLSGKMSIVGPRPALPEQRRLVKLRNKRGVQNVKPGITGWAQINGRDELSIEQKVDLDAEYLEKKSLSFDMQILFLTVRSVFLARNINH